MANDELFIEYTGKNLMDALKNAQKALGFISDLTTKNQTPSVSPKGPLNPRPLNKFFED